MAARVWASPRCDTGMRFSYRMLLISIGLGFSPLRQSLQQRPQQFHAVARAFTDLSGQVGIKILDIIALALVTRHSLGKVTTGLALQATVAVCARAHIQHRE